MHGLQGDLVTEFLESSDEIASKALRIEPVEVVGTELLKWNGRSKHVVRRDENRVGDGDDRAFLPATGRETTVLGGEVRVLGSAGRPRGFGQTTPEPAIPLGGLAALALPSALVVAGAQTGPGREVCRGGELLHVRPDLSDQVLRRPLLDPRDGRQPLDGFLKRARHLLDPIVESCDLRIEEFKVIEQGLEEEPMVVPDATVEGKTQIGDLAAQAPQSQFGELFGVFLAFHDGLDHRPTRDPEDVAGHSPELDVGVFEGLVDAIDDRCAVSNELRPMAREVAQLTNRRRGHEAPTQQTMLEKLSDPFAILDVRLPTGNLLDVPGIDEEDLETPLENVPDGLPEHSRGLHRHVRDAGFGHPIRQSKQVRGHRRERPNLGVELAVLPDDPAARNDGLLMDVQTTATPVHYLHGSLLDGEPVGGPPEKNDSDTRSPGKAGETISGTKGGPGQTSPRARSTKGKTASFPTASMNECTGLDSIFMISGRRGRHGD